ncbi:CD225/dispanin family protein [Aquipuribacter nitratireducens]|uniref:CD225/dispanin family protein n=1 Tax=Aquipuribacter nitratireducens TaxID=650104 RepID=A0ABW0GR06_9MICO
MSTPYEPAPAGPPASEPPPSNLVWAILTTVLCCLPFGIVSIVFAAQVNSKWATGDFSGAQDASRKARLWAIVAAVAGIVYLVVVIGLFSAGIMAVPTEGQL